MSSLRERQSLGLDSTLPFSLSRAERLLGERVRDQSVNLRRHRFDVRGGVNAHDVLGLIPGGQELGVFTVLREALSNDLRLVISAVALPHTFCYYVVGRFEQNHFWSWQSILSQDVIEEFGLTCGTRIAIQNESPDRVRLQYPCLYEIIHCVVIDQIAACQSYFQGLRKFTSLSVPFFTNSAISMDGILYFLPRSLDCVLLPLPGGPIMTKTMGGASGDC